MFLRRNEYGELKLLAGAYALPKPNVDDLTELLTMRGGELLLEKSRNRCLLTNSDRSALATYIVAHVIHGQEFYYSPVRHEVWEHWTKEILRLFPNEFAKSWFVRKTGEN